MPSDPHKRIGSIKGIAGTNIFIAALSLFFHIWSLVWTVKEPIERLAHTGQTEMVVYMGISIMILINLILIIVSVMLLKRLSQTPCEPSLLTQRCKTWKRWCACFLTFYIIALMILVLSSGNNVHKGVIQNYMAFLLILIGFTIFGIYYVSCFIKEMEVCNQATIAGSCVHNPSGCDTLLPSTSGSGSNAVIKHSENQII